MTYQEANEQFSPTVMEGNQMKKASSNHVSNASNPVKEQIRKQEGARRHGGHELATS